MTLLTTKDVARQLRVSEVTVKRLVHRGEIPFYKVGKLIRYPEDAVERLLRPEGKSGANM